ncbi:hypothetical protein SDC9_146555 [bioreactor metagenome]|uniref:Uncharacterized protein n=1 Tax=bioreactor metagenome TaxID=1076179 RepID=A0A645EBE2_9ZZZZ
MFTKIKTIAYSPNKLLTNIDRATTHSCSYSTSFINNITAHANHNKMTGTTLQLRNNAYYFHGKGDDFLTLYNR